jgi:hypothetical protein
MIHKEHGTFIAYLDSEVEECIKNGWEVEHPTPAFLTPVDKEPETVKIEAQEEPVKRKPGRKPRTE